MNCGTFNSSGGDAMNDGEFNRNHGDNKEGGDQKERNGASFKDPLTKEQLARIEATFLRFVSNEMEENLSNWEEFYELLNDACHSDMQPPLKNKSNLYKEKMEDEKKEEGADYPNRCAGFKINTEATKKQYRTCKPTSNSAFYEPKQNIPSEEETAKQYDNFSDKQNGCQFTNCKEDKQQNSEKHNSPLNGKQCANEVKNNSESPSMYTKNTKKKAPKTSRTPKDNISTVDNSDTSKVAPDVSSSNVPLPLRNFKSYAHDYYLKYMVIMSYMNSTSKWCWVKTKEITLLVVCVLLIVVVAVWKLLWFLIRLLLKVTLFVVLWVVCKVVNCVIAVHLKYDVFGKIKCYISNGSDLIFLITGLNFKSIFSRKQKDKADVMEDNNLLVALPSSPEEAVEHLMHHTEDKPFRALCVNRQSTNDEIKANYRKMALLVHPDKCFDTQADEAFKVLDSAFKTLTDPDKRNKLMEEEKRRREWEEFTKQYSSFNDDFEAIFNDMVNSIACSKCHGKHKRRLVQDRTFYEARYCGDCHKRHSANDGDIWAENNIFGLNWTCYVCMDGEIYELTQWAECQDLRKTIPINCHRVVCRLGNQRPASNGNRRRNKQNESSEPKRSRKKRRQKGRKS